MVFSSISEQSSTLIAGLALSHLAHWLSVVQLYSLATALVGEHRVSSSSTAPFYAAALHIFSPAGVFLSAPYTESLFAFLSMSGFLEYTRATHHFARDRLFAGGIGMIVAGTAFGMSTLVRSNGILAGISFLFEAITTALAIIGQGPSLPRISRLASVVVGGLLVAVGMLTPQVIAYWEYCHAPKAGDRRPWCDFVFPSIFTWVQSHYW